MPKVAAACAGAAPTSNPNILLIIADDLGLDWSNQYSLSADRPRTPNLDTLAAAGIVFDNAWATPACTTTRASIITGQHGVHSGVTFVPAVMDPASNTLQRFLKSSSATAEYQTAVVGKWHLGGSRPSNSHPLDSGVGYYAGHLAADIPDYYNWPLVEGGLSSTSTVYNTTKLTDLAVNWVQQQAKPWFLWLAYSAPHQPFHLPPGHLHARSGLTGSAADIAARPRQYYLAAIEAMDAEIGRLLASMDPATRANTLILFVGDNGTPQQAVDPSVFNSRRVKGTLFEGGIRVPMIVSGKGVGLSNSREAALVNTVDFYATIAHIAGHSATQIGNSYSFAALLQSGGVAMRQYNYSEFQSTSVNGWTVRDARFKLIQNDSGTQELYDLSTDLTEQNNLLSGGADYSATVNALKLYGTELRR